MDDKNRKDIVAYRLSRAKETFNEVKLHIESELWNTAINRLYYACYHAVIALLIDNKIEAQSHAGVRQMFGLHFIKTGILEKSLGKLFSELYDLRQTSDYADFIDFTKDEVLDIMPEADKFIHEIEKLLTKSK
jgi:uncharacterized protein (UPF0332 family)